MKSYDVKTFKAKGAKHVGDDLAGFLNQLAGEGWDVVSVLPAGLKAKGAGFTSQRPDSFLVVVARPGE